MARFVLVGILCFVAVICTSATTYDDCGSVSGQVSEVEVSGCPDDEDACPLKRGSNALITIRFNSNVDTKSLKTVVHGVIAGVPLPFPLPQPDACKSGIACPVVKGQNYTYSNKLEVKKAYPPVSVTVRYELKGEKGDDLVCIEIPSKLV